MAAAVVVIVAEAPRICGTVINGQVPVFAVPPKSAAAVHTSFALGQVSTPLKPVNDRVAPVLGQALVTQELMSVGHTEIDNEGAPFVHVHLYL